MAGGSHRGGGDLGDRGRACIFYGEGQGSTLEEWERAMEDVAEERRRKHKDGFSLYHRYREALSYTGGSAKLVAEQHFLDNREKITAFQHLVAPGYAADFRTPGHAAGGAGVSVGYALGSGGGHASGGAGASSAASGASGAGGPGAAAGGSGAASSSGSGAGSSGAGGAAAGAGGASGGGTAGGAGGAAVPPDPGAPPVQGSMTVVQHQAALEAWRIQVMAWMSHLRVGGAGAGGPAGSAGGAGAAASASGAAGSSGGVALAPALGAGAMGAPPPGMPQAVSAALGPAGVHVTIAGGAVVVITWDPFLDLLEKFEEVFEAVSADKLTAFYSFTRQPEETALVAGDRFRRICKRAKQLDNSTLVAKWLSALPKSIAEKVCAAPGARVGLEYGPLATVIALTIQEEGFQARAKGLLMVVGGRKEERKEERYSGGEGKKPWGNKARGGSSQPQSYFHAAPSFVAEPTPITPASRGCYICGGGHLKRDCNLQGRTLTCSSCQGKGHLAAACNARKATGGQAPGSSGRQQKLRSPSNPAGGGNQAARTGGGNRSGGQVPGYAGPAGPVPPYADGWEPAMAPGPSWNSMLAAPGYGGAPAGGQGGGKGVSRGGRHYSATAALIGQPWEEELEVEEPVPGMVGEAHTGRIQTRSRTVAQEPRGASAEQDAQRGERRTQTRLPKSFQVMPDLVGGHLPATGRPPLARAAPPPATTAPQGALTQSETVHQDLSGGAQ
jgi:hypothetical protein